MFVKGKLRNSYQLCEFILLWNVDVQKKKKRSVLLADKRALRVKIAILERLISKKIGDRVNFGACDVRILGNLT